jgi:CrcB protein
MNNLLLIFIGGGIGSICRYGVSQFFTNNFNINFPAGTFISNLLSCFFLGITVYLFTLKGENSILKPLVLIGFCGGFSTFSTFSYETLNLFKSGNYVIAITNILVSVIICIALLYLLSKNS